MFFVHISGTGGYGPAVTASTGEIPLLFGSPCGGTEGGDMKVRAFQQLLPADLGLCTFVEMTPTRVSALDFVSTFVAVPGAGMGALCSE